MKDRELLEMAAKAVGLDDARYCTFAGMEERIGFGGAIYSDKHAAGMGSGYWNPLEDDGDALRLAVKLGIEIHHGWDDGEIVMGAWFPETSGKPQRFEVEWIGDDSYAPTRRAIVRAAAEIGKGKK